MRTAQDDRHEGRDQGTAFAFGQALAVHQCKAGFGRRDLNRPGFVLGQISHERPGVRGRGEYIDKREALAQPFAAAHTDQTAHQVDDQVRIVLFKRVQGMQPAVGFVLGGLANDTGVQDDDVGLFRLFGMAVAQVFKGRPQALRVGHVHLAAFRPNMILHVRYYTASPPLRNGAALRQAVILGLGFHGKISPLGGMTERLKVTVLKTVVAQATVGSNPTPSACPPPRGILGRWGGARVADWARLLSECWDINLSRGFESRPPRSYTAEALS